MNAIHKFETWLRRSGFQFPKCRIRFYEESNRGVEALESIATGEAVITVPDEMVLYPENSSLFETLSKHNFTNSSGNPWKELAGLIICLMHETLEKTNSKWYNYVQFLPKTMPNLPLFWNDLELLKGTSVAEKMNLSGNQLSSKLYMQPPCQVEALFKRFVLPFVVHCLKGSTLKNLTVAELNVLFKWAVGIISSYSFTLGDDHFQALVPLWDALNHKTGQANVSLKHCPNEGTLKMVATKDIHKGKELVNCFGSLSSSELLRRFGFVESNLKNPHNNPEISLVEMAKVCRFLKGATKFEIKRKLKVLSRTQTIPSNGWFTISRNRKISQSLTTCLQFLMLSRKDNKSEGHLSVFNEEQVFRFIGRYKLAKLKQIAIAKNMSVNAIQRWAKIIRRDETRVWKDFLTHL